MLISQLFIFRKDVYVIIKTANWIQNLFKQASSIFNPNPNPNPKPNPLWLK